MRPGETYMPTIFFTCIYIHAFKNNCFGAVCQSTVIAIQRNSAYIVWKFIKRDGNL